MHLTIPTLLPYHLLLCFSRTRGTGTNPQVPVNTVSTNSSRKNTATSSARKPPINTERHSTSRPPPPQSSSPTSSSVPGKQSKSACKPLSRPSQGEPLRGGIRLLPPRESLGMLPIPCTQMPPNSPPTQTNPTQHPRGGVHVDKVANGSLYKGLQPLWGRQIPYTMMKFASFERVVEYIYSKLPKEKHEYGKLVQTEVPPSALSPWWCCACRPHTCFPAFLHGAVFCFLPSLTYYPLFARCHLPHEYSFYPPSPLACARSHCSTSRNLSAVLLPPVRTY